MKGATITAGTPVPFSITVDGLASRAARLRAADAYLAERGCTRIDDDDDGRHVWFATHDELAHATAAGTLESLLPIDVGSDLRRQRTVVVLRPETRFVRYVDRAGVERVAGSQSRDAGTRIAAQLRAAGFRVEGRT